VQPVSRTLSLAWKDWFGPRTSAISVPEELVRLLLARAYWSRSTNDALFLLDHLAAHLDRLGLAAAADLDQDRRLEIAALHIVLDAIAVFARCELRKRPFPRIQAIALLLHLDLIGARPVGDLEQLLEQAIGALFSPRLGLPEAKKKG
jgi:hypothetical protein